MPAISVDCPQCFRTYMVEPQAGPSTMSCRRCGATIPVPARPPGATTPSGAGNSTSRAVQEALSAKRGIKRGPTERIISGGELTPAPARPAVSDVELPSFKFNMPTSGTNRPAVSDVELPTFAVGQSAPPPPPPFSPAATPKQAPAVSDVELPSLGHRPTPAVSDVELPSFGSRPARTSDVNLTPTHLTDLASSSETPPPPTSRTGIPVPPPPPSSTPTSSFATNPAFLDPPKPRLGRVTEARTTAEPPRPPTAAPTSESSPPAASAPTFSRPDTKRERMLAALGASAADTAALPKPLPPPTPTPPTEPAKPAEPSVFTRRLGRVSFADDKPKTDTAPSTDIAASPPASPTSTTAPVASTGPALGGTSMSTDAWRMVNQWKKGQIAAHELIASIGDPALAEQVRTAIIKLGGTIETPTPPSAPAPTVTPPASASTSLPPPVASTLTPAEAIATETTFLEVEPAPKTNKVETPDSAFSTQLWGETEISREIKPDYMPEAKTLSAESAATTLTSVQDKISVNRDTPESIAPPTPTITESVAGQEVPVEEVGVEEFQSATTEALADETSTATIEMKPPAISGITESTELAEPASTPTAPTADAQTELTPKSHLADEPPRLRTLEVEITMPSEIDLEDVRRELSKETLDKAIERASTELGLTSDAPSVGTDAAETKTPEPAGTTTAKAPTEAETVEIENQLLPTVHATPQAAVIVESAPPPTPQLETPPANTTAPTVTESVSAPSPTVVPVAPFVVQMLGAPTVETELPTPIRSKLGDVATRFMTPAKSFADTKPTTDTPASAPLEPKPQKASRRKGAVEVVVREVSEEWGESEPEPAVPVPIGSATFKLGASTLPSSLPEGLVSPTPMLADSSGDSGRGRGEPIEEATQLDIWFDAEATTDASAGLQADWELAEELIRTTVSGETMVPKAELEAKAQADAQRRVQPSAPASRLGRKAKPAEKRPSHLAGLTLTPSGDVEPPSDLRLSVEPASPLDSEPAPGTLITIGGVTYTVMSGDDAVQRLLRSGELPEGTYVHALDLGYFPNNWDEPTDWNLRAPLASRMVAREEDFFIPKGGPMSSDCIPVAWPQRAIKIHRCCLGTLSLNRATFPHGFALTESRILSRMAAVRTRFDGWVDFSRTVFPMICAFFQARATGSVTFRRAYFTGLAYFAELRFDGFTSFRQADIAGDFDLTGSRFGHDLDLREVVVMGNGAFSQLNVQGAMDASDLGIHGEADFQNVQFAGPARFANMACGGTFTLQRAKFAREADLTGARFCGPMHIAQAKFAHDLKLTRGRFGSLFDAYHVEVTGALDLTEAICHGDAMFNGGRFQGLVRFNVDPISRIKVEQSQRGAEFKAGLSFDHAVLHKPLLASGVRFRGRTTFRRTTFEESANFADASFATGLDLGESFVTKELDLRGSTLGGRLNLNGLHVSGRSSLRGARFRALSLAEATLNVLALDKHQLFPDAQDLRDNRADPEVPPFRPFERQFPVKLHSFRFATINPDPALAGGTGKTMTPQQRAAQSWARMIGGLDAELKLDEGGARLVAFDRAREEFALLEKSFRAQGQHDFADWAMLNSRRMERSGQALAAKGIKPVDENLLAVEREIAALEDLRRRIETEAVTDPQYPAELRDRRAKLLAGSGEAGESWARLKDILLKSIRARLEPLHEKRRRVLDRLKPLEMPRPRNEWEQYAVPLKWHLRNVFSALHDFTTAYGTQPGRVAALALVIILAFGLFFTRYSYLEEAHLPTAEQRAIQLQPPATATVPRVVTTTTHNDSEPPATLVDPHDGHGAWDRLREYSIYSFKAFIGQGFGASHPRAGHWMVWVVLAEMLLGVTLIVLFITTWVRKLLR